jgi:hypothetical protein
MIFDAKEYRSRVLKPFRSARNRELQDALRELKSGARVPSFLDLAEVYDITTTMSDADVSARVAEVADAWNKTAHNAVYSSLTPTLSEFHRLLKDLNPDLGTSAFFFAAARNRQRKNLIQFAENVAAEHQTLGIMTEDLVRQAATAAKIPTSVTAADLAKAVKAHGVTVVRPFIAPAVPVPEAVAKLRETTFRSVIEVLFLENPPVTFSLIDGFSTSDGKRLTLAQVQSSRELTGRRTRSVENDAANAALLALGAAANDDATLADIVLASFLDLAREARSSDLVLTALKRLTDTGLIRRDAARMLLQLGAIGSKGTMAEVLIKVREGKIKVREGAIKDARPFPFVGFNHFKPTALAERMAGAWDSAITDVIQRPDQLDELEEWLWVHDPSLTLVQAIQSCRDGRLHPDRLVSSLISQLAPTLKPTFRGYGIEPTELHDLAKAACVAGGDKCLDALSHLFESRALNAYTQHEGCHDYSLLDDQWRRNIAALSDSFKGIGPVDVETVRRLQSQPIDVARLLLALSSPDSLDELRNQANEVNSRRARSQGWYRRLVDQPFESELEPAQLWLKLNAAALAIRQYEHIERLASDVLANRIDPVGGYEEAREVAQAASGLLGSDSRQLVQRIQPLLSEGNASRRVAHLAAQIPLATALLRTLNTQAESSAAEFKKVASRHMADVEGMPTAPVNHVGIAPQVPDADWQAEGFRRVSMQALAAAIAAPLDWIWGATTYKNNDNAPGAIWFLQVAILIVCGFVVWAWFASIADGREGREREKAAKILYVRETAEYNRRRREYVHLKDLWDRALGAHSKLLNEAKERQGRDYRTAGDLDAIALRLSAAAESLAEIDALPALQEFSEKVIDSE